MGFAEIRTICHLSGLSVFFRATPWATGHLPFVDSLPGSVPGRGRRWPLSRL